MEPLHLREGLQDRVPHLDDIDVRHEVEDGGREPLEQGRRAALAARAREERLGARVRGRRGREGRRGLLVVVLRLLTDKKRGARVLPGGPGREPPRGSGGEGSCFGGFRDEEGRVSGVT